VSSDLPQVRSAFGEAVTYVTADNVEGFSSKLIKILSGEVESKLNPTFGWKQTVTETTELLQQIAERR
jgi:hypothetical protein